MLRIQHGLRRLHYGESLARVSAITSRQDRVGWSNRLCRKGSSAIRHSSPSEFPQPSSKSLHDSNVPGDTTTASTPGRDDVQNQGTSKAETTSSAQDRPARKEKPPKRLESLGAEPVEDNPASSPAVRDVIDYAAIHGYLPNFSYSEVQVDDLKGTSRTLFKVHAYIPSLGLAGDGSSYQSTHALVAACDSLKTAITEHHDKMGGGRLLVKDYTLLNTKSAEKFVDYYCWQRNFAKERVESECISSSWKTTIRLARKAAAVSQNSIPEQFYTGIALPDLKLAIRTCFIAAAIQLKADDPDLWAEFVEKTQQGGGEINRPMSSIDLDLGVDSVDVILDTITDGTKSSSMLSYSDRYPKREFNCGRRYRSLTTSEMDEKSIELKKRLAQSHATLSRIRIQAATLPISQRQESITRLLRENDVIVIVGATGSGKTTQVPQIILDEAIRANEGAHCNIICTQPRRMAAISVARRIAEERGESLGNTVGYEVRYDRMPPAFHGSIKFCTTGLLLRHLQFGMDWLLNGVSHIIVDEVHERTTYNDILLAVLKMTMKDRKAAGKPAIKLILMSATIDAETFCKYFGEDYESGMCPQLNVEGRTFPVTEHYFDEVWSDLRSKYGKSLRVDQLHGEADSHYINNEVRRPFRLSLPTSNHEVSGDGKERGKAIIDWKSYGGTRRGGEIYTDPSIDVRVPIGLMGLTIANILKTTSKGSILVFLPGYKEILALEQYLTESAFLGIQVGFGTKCKLVKLHSSLPLVQQEVFLALGEDERMIILATNIAETSITIPDVVYVVDSCKHRQLEYDNIRQLDTLSPEWIAKANARQRAGRAGRVQHGHYYSMVTKERYESFDMSPKPQILRDNLSLFCLQVKTLGANNIASFMRGAIQPPSPTAVSTAINELQTIGALDGNEDVTHLGDCLAGMPVAPTVGKMMILGAIFKCLDPMLILAAASDEISPFKVPAEEDLRIQAKAIRMSWALGTTSDHFAVLNAFGEWRRLRSTIGGSWAATKFAEQNHLSEEVLKRIARSAEHMLHELKMAGIIQASYLQPSDCRYGSEAVNKYSASHALQTALMTAGLFQNMAVRHPSQHKRDKELRTAREARTAIASDSLSWLGFKSEKSLPMGLYIASHKRRVEDNPKTYLNSVTRTYPLAVALFGGRTTVEDESASDKQTLVVNGWIRLQAPLEDMSPVILLNEVLEDYLQRTYSRLAKGFCDRTLRYSAKTILDEDPARDPVVDGVVKALELSMPEDLIDVKQNDQDLMDILENPGWDARILDVKKNDMEDEDESSQGTGFCRPYTAWTDGTLNTGQSKVGKDGHVHLILSRDSCPPRVELSATPYSAEHSLV